MNTVFPPIKDGINNWVRGAENALNNAMIDFEGTGSFDINSLGSKIFGGAFFIAITIIIVVITAITTIISPFTGIVAGIIGTVADFIIPMIITIVASSISDEGISDILVSILNGDVSEFLGILPDLLFNNDNSKSRGSWDDFLYWAPIFISVISGWMAAYALCYAGKKVRLGEELPNGIKGVIGDAFGLIISVIGLVLALSSSDIWGTFTGFGLAAAGAIICKKSDSSKINKLFNNVANGFSYAGFIISWIGTLNTLSRK